MFNIQELIQNKTYMAAILTFCLIMFCSLSFVAGGWYSCNAGGGTLNGLKCTEMNITDIITDQVGNKFIDHKQDNIYYNLSEAMDKIQ